MPRNNARKGAASLGATNGTNGYPTSPSKGKREGAALLAFTNGTNTASRQGDALLALVGGGTQGKAARQGEALLALLNGKSPAPAQTLSVPMRALILRMDENGSGLRLASCSSGYKVSRIAKKPGQPGLQVGDVLTVVGGCSLTGCSDVEIMERWQKNAVDGAEMLVAAGSDLEKGSPERARVSPSGKAKPSSPVKGGSTPVKQALPKAKIVSQVEWVVAKKDVEKLGQKVESPKINIKGLSDFRLVLFPGTAKVPGVELGRSSQGFSRVLLVPNMTAVVPPKPGLSFWPLFSHHNPCDVPFRLLLNGKKSTVLSGALWYDFPSMAEPLDMATVAVEVLDSAGEPPDTPDKTLRPDTPAFVPGKKELRADAKEFVPGAIGMPGMPLGFPMKGLQINTSGFGFPMPGLSPHRSSGKPDSPSRFFQYRVQPGAPSPTSGKGTAQGQLH